MRIVPASLLALALVMYAMGQTAGQSNPTGAQQGTTMQQGTTPGMPQGTTSGTQADTTTGGQQDTTTGTQQDATTGSQQAPSQQGQGADPARSTTGFSATAAAPVIPGYKINEEGMPRPVARIAREVRHEIAMLPRYTLFDDIRFRVNGTTVELLGDVVNASLKSDAESAVRGIEGVEQVVNHVNVITSSPQDDRLRAQVARAVFNAAGLGRYAWQAAPAIHIIVNNGRVRLSGVVDNASDKQIAYVQAASVPGTVSVENDLLVQSR